MLNDARLDIPCPHYGKKVSQTLAWLQAHDHFTCSGCRKRVTIDSSDLAKGLKSAEKTLGTLGAGIKGFRKR